MKAVRLATGLVAIAMLGGCGGAVETGDATTTFAATTGIASTTTDGGPPTSVGKTTPGAPTTATSTSTSEVDTTVVTTTAAPTTTRPAPTTTTSTTTGATTTTRVTTTTTPAACSGPSTPLPTDATDVATIVVDVNGDGSADTVTGYRLAGAWYLHVALAGGWGTVLRVDTITPASAPAASPAAVVPLAGHRLLVADLGGVLPGTVYGFFEFRDCAIVAVTLPSGDLPATYIGGGLHHSEWFTCSSGEVVQVVATREDDPEFGALSAYTYRYDPITGGFIDEGEEVVILDPPASLDALLADYPACIPG